MYLHFIRIPQHCQQLDNIFRKIHMNHDKFKFAQYIYLHIKLLNIYKYFQEFMGLGNIHKKPQNNSKLQATERNI